MRAKVVRYAGATSMIRGRLIDAYIAALRHAGSDVEIDLTVDPVSVLASSPGGPVFAAAWDDGETLVVRLRHDAIAGSDPRLEHVEGGALAYEVRLTTIDEIDSMEDMLVTSLRLASEGRPAHRGPENE
jgi:hypothetical protein